jgi:amidohydrolase
VHGKTSPTRLSALKERTAAAVAAQQAALTELGLRIHAAPEIRFEEQKACKWLSDYLETAGFTVERGAYSLPTAFRAQIGTGRPCVAILCEYDALPGIGHGCGHNLIAVAGAGAGAGLVDCIDSIQGSVVVLGTPAEEGGGGKVIMARRGAFEDVDAAMMIHPAGADLPCLQSLAVTQLEVEYRGRAAHASAAPERGVNALDGLVTAYNAIAQLRQHIGPRERVHGIITDGGQAANVVPERATGLFYVRAPTSRALRVLKERVTACFRAGTEASGAELTLGTAGEDYTEVWTNGPLLEAYADNLKRVGLPPLNEGTVPRPIAGSTDMGNVSQMTPAIHPIVAAVPPEVALHTVEFAEHAGSEAALQVAINGAKVLAMTALDVLGNADLRAAMCADFEGTRREQTE